jgi:hypothetical protein
MMDGTSRQAFSLGTMNNLHPLDFLEYHSSVSQRVPRVKRALESTARFN